MAHFGLGLNDMLDIGIGPLGELQLLQLQQAQFEALPERPARVYLRPAVPAATGAGDAAARV